MRSSDYCILLNPDLGVSELHHAAQVEIWCSDGGEQDSVSRSETLGHRLVLTVSTEREDLHGISLDVTSSQEVLGALRRSGDLRRVVRA